MIHKLFNKIYFYFFRKAVYRAIRRANKEKELTKYKMVVMKVNGWPRVFRKADLKELRNRRKFKKGLSLKDILKKALYITP